MGPAGGVIRGLPGTDLEGTVVTVPAGALDGIHEVVLESAPAMSFPGALPVGPALRVRMSPDPGLLRRPLFVRVRVQLPTFQYPGDLLILNGSQTIDPQGKMSSLAVKPGILDTGVTLNGKFFIGSARRSGVYQAFRTRTSRSRSGAEKIMALGLAELRKGRLSSLRRAGFLFERALESDPFSSDVRFLAALSRLLVLFSSEDDGTRSIDSLGEVFERLGFSLGLKSIFARLIDGDWNLVFRPTAQSPRFAEILEYLDRRALPELHSILADLHHVGDDVLFGLDMAHFGQPLLGWRELDLGDVASVRAFVNAVTFVIELVSRFDLDVDLASLHGKLRSGATLQSVLTLYPKLGTARVQPRSTEASTLYRFLSSQYEALVSIDREVDDQRDDLLVFATWFDEASKLELLDSLEQALDNLRRGTRVRARMPGAAGLLLVDLKGFLGNSSFSPRALLPEVSGNDLLGGKIPDPSVGGLLPSLDAAQVLQRLELPTRASLVSAKIRIDGSFVDWPSQAEVLTPADPLRDARGQGKHPAIDLHRLFMAKSGDQLAIRVLLGDGNPLPNQSFAIQYRILIQDRSASRIASSRREILLDLGTKQARAWLLVPSDLPGTPPGQGPGVPGMRASEIPMALGPLGFEVLVPLSTFVAPLRERVVSVRSSSLDRSRGTAGGDHTRRVFISF